MNVVENYYNKKQDIDAIHNIENNPEEYEEFARLHPELYITVKPKRYTLLDEKGRVREAWEQKDDGHYKDVTLVEVAKQELEKAESDYHRQLRKELIEKQKAKKEEVNA